MRKFYMVVESGRIKNRKQVDEALRGIKDGTYAVEVKSANQRSLSRNSFYWAFHLPPAIQGFRDAGYEVSEAEEIHEFFKRRYLTKQLISKISGEMLESIGSTTSLNNEDFDHYMEQCAQFGAEYLGTYMPLYNDPTNRLQEYANGNL